jgi:hypothetical protein
MTKNSSSTTLLHLREKKGEKKLIFLFSLTFRSQFSFFNGKVAVSLIVDRVKKRGEEGKKLIMFAYTNV